MGVERKGLSNMFWIVLGLIIVLLLAGLLAIITTDILPWAKDGITTVGELGGLAE